MSTIEERVINQIRTRAKVGENKYGTTMDRNDLSLIEWLQHLQEELMDACVYVEKIKQEIHYTDEIDPEMAVYGVRRGPCSMHDEVSEEEIEGSIAADLAEIEREKRMNIIGQNGNDGLHYDELTYLVNKTTMYPGDIDVTYTTVNEKKTKK